jgi:hypothetical protein
VSQPLNLPPDIVGYTHPQRLGRPVAVYHPKRLAVWRVVLLSLFFLGMVGLGLVFVAAFGVSGWPLLLIFGGLSIPFLLILLRSPNFNRRQAARRVYVFEYGLLHVDGKGALGEYPWHSIMSVQQKIVEQYVNGIHTGTTYLYTVTRNDGTVLKLTHFFNGIAQLGQGISQQVTQIHLPHAVAAIQRGETVPFGDLAVNAAGVVSVRHGLLPWAELDEVRVVQGYVRLRKAGKWLPWSHKPAAEIPNLFVFLTLADQLQRAAHSHR